jgi:hypothetical protein
VWTWQREQDDFPFSQMEMNCARAKRDGRIREFDGQLNINAPKLSFKSARLSAWS